MEKNQKRIAINHGSAVVDKDVSQETIDAINKMVDLAYNQVNLTQPIDPKHEAFPNHDFMIEGINAMHKDLSNKIEAAIIEGLRRKGFRFDLKYQLEVFVKKRCKCEDNIFLKQKIYYVDDIPFFLHDYSSQFDFKTTMSIDNRSIFVNGTLGCFSYL